MNEVTERVAADRLWRDHGARLQFEKETGLEPLCDANLQYDKWNAQVYNGHMMDYHHKFFEWAKERVKQPRDFL